MFFCKTCKETDNRPGVCEQCYEDAHLLNDMYTKGQRDAWADIVKISREAWTIEKS